MSLLPGRFIDKEVSKQIAKRQEVIGNKDRLPLFSKTDPRSYNFFLTKTPFIKLTSGIDKSGLQDPARQAILDNGYRGRGGDTSGIVPGYEFSDDFGMRPGAGIVGMTLQTHNRYGSLRTATVQFEVHSLEQMNLYEEMFMRPGYSALLEWGHSVWLDSETGEVNDMPPLLSESFIRKSLVSDILPSRLSEDEIANESKQAIYLAIEEMRRRTDYNYDGMYGLIKNFSWALRPDGGYSCTVDIVSIGTVIESLTINAGVSIQEKLVFIQNQESEPLESTGLEKIKYIPGTSIPSSGQIPKISVLGESELAKRTLSPQQQAFLSFLQTDLFPPQLVKRTVPENFSEKIGTWISNLFVGDEFEKEYTKEVDYTAFIPLTSFGKELLGSNIVYNVSAADTSFRFNVASRAEFSSRDLPALESLPIYTELKGYSRVIKDTVTNSSFKYTFKLEEIPEKPTSQKVDIAGPAYLRFWNLQYTVIVESVPEDSRAGDSKPTSAESEASIEASEVNLSQFIKEFAPYYNSRVHLHLHLLKRDLIRFIAPSLDGFPPTEVYQEIEFKSESDKNSKSYRTETFPILTPQLTSKYTTGAVRRKLGEGTDGFHHYVQLGTFLDILNLYIPSTKSTSETLFKYHTDKDSPHRYKTLERLHASVDITKCILPESYGISNYTTRGDILGIFIEIDYLLGLLETGLVNGDLKGYDIITEILRDINVSVGQINELALQYHEESFTFHIIDRNLVGEEDSREAVLQLIGRNTILRNITMNSKLSPNISTQIAISAQADPTSNGINGTLFERFNKNLKDRYIPEKKTNLEHEQSAKTQEEQEKLEKLAVVFNFLRYVYGTSSFTNQQVTLPGVINEYRLLTSIELGKEKPDRSYGGILPFELGLEIEGISGLQVMDSFLINQNILPKSYVGDGNFGFLITGLTHKVDSNGWVVEARSQIYNRPKGASRKASTGKFNPDSEDREFQLVKENHTPWKGDTPQANKVRVINAQNGGTIKKKDDYDYDELSSGADIQPFLATTTVNFIKAFRKEYSDYNIRITGGNDVWHHNHAPASQHTKGRGLDFTIRKGNTELGSDDKIIIEISNWIGGYFADMKEDVYYLDEYNETRQSNHATGNHFHFHVLKDE